MVDVAQVHPQSYFLEFCNQPIALWGIRIGLLVVVGIVVWLICSASKKSDQPAGVSGQSVVPKKSSGEAVDEPHEGKRE